MQETHLKSRMTTLKSAMYANSRLTTLGYVKEALEQQDDDIAIGDACKQKADDD